MRFAFLLIPMVVGITSSVKANPGDKSQVDVRAVFINCEPKDRESVDNAATRFEREELFKHGVLQDCNKKLALTVKIASELNQNSGDEFIPIEHVFQGANKRVRLLNPYVLRLRRELPLQAYKLRKISVVTGVLTNTDEKLARASNKIDQKFRDLSKRSPNPYDMSKSSGKDRNAQDCELSENNISNNVCLKNRDKRHEHNIVVENAINEEKYPPWIAKDHSDQELDRHRESQNNLHVSRNLPRDQIERLNNNLDDKPIQFDSKSNDLTRSNSWSSYQNEKHDMRTGNTELSDNNSKDNWIPDENRVTNSQYSTKQNYRKDKLASSEEEFDMYEIGNPDLLYTVQVQLFEKLISPDGKTVWNDMTKGEPASLSTLSPEWMVKDVSIRYRPKEWVPREEFTLPQTSLCLLTPLPSLDTKESDAKNLRASRDAEKYIVVPKEDILSEDEDATVQKRDGNPSDVQYSTEQNEQCRRRVVIRTSRAIFGSKEDNLNIAVNGGEQYLTLPHRRRPFHVQIDLEARADENQLVPIGVSGRIMTVVSDSSRRTKTTLTVQVTNTGLAAAKFRAVARDCGPELMALQNDDSEETFSVSPILLPPRNTQSIRLDVPYEIPADVTHCLVSLLNEEDESVAVRDVTIKKGDRCFCVWHCECVCLSEDPKLLCREMTEARQVAAGLSLRERVRHARSVCYHDVVSINMLVTGFGVLIMLLFFGLLKGCFGLICRCVGSWGLHRIVQMPRKLEHYYESVLENRPVIYDSAGWPVHPDTKDRTVRLVSMPVEFILNMLFFVITPCIIIYDIVKEIHNCFKKSEDNDWYPSEKDKNCFNSSHDIQSPKPRRRRRRHGIKKWMSPGAEELSTNIWQGGLPPGNSAITCMQPLLCEEFCRGEKPVAQQSCVDSEGEDTEYVLMQMQKSKESLARSQRKLNGSEKEVVLLKEK